MTQRYTHKLALFAIITLLSTGCHAEQAIEQDRTAQEVAQHKIIERDTRLLITMMDTVARDALIGTTLGGLVGAGHGLYQISIFPGCLYPLTTFSLCTATGMCVGTYRIALLSLCLRLIAFAARSKDQETAPQQNETAQT